MRAPDRIFGGYVFDLDGTVYLGDELLPGAAETLAELKRLSRVVYLTNKPLETPADYAAKLTRLGLETSPEEVVSSTDALLRYLEAHAPGARLFVIGEYPLLSLLRAAGYPVVDEAEGVEVVVVSFDRTFDYRKLRVAFDAVRAGARIVATNPDAYCPTANGGLPDCAAMLAAVEACTGVLAEAIVGKPSEHMAATLLDRLGVSAQDALLVGDRLATDVRMAKRTGMHAALVLTGATGPEEALKSSEEPDYVIGSLRELLPENIERS
ncbi:Sugar-phosphatase AraL [Rubrobacter xylanophilus DSM 9941]|uniref:HAD-IIA family hydrolase n=1 Tax=Rubrobacter xylanophilus TaxID=49319 RepID=UPI001C643EED|nr:HAD-IIA family hydrolase [Rubrobacter xylanophilus]QYJ16069.1 Sugar-phosphatase AraL [Rubrobacter xylanophilus DSM 9941]